MPIVVKKLSRIVSGGLTLVTFLALSQTPVSAHPGHGMHTERLTPNHVNQKNEEETSYHEYERSQTDNRVISGCKPEIKITHSSDNQEEQQDFDHEPNAPDEDCCNQCDFLAAVILGFQSVKVDKKPLLTGFNTNFQVSHNSTAVSYIDFRDLSPPTLLQSTLRFRILLI